MSDKSLITVTTGKNSLGIMVVHWKAAGVVMLALALLAVLLVLRYFSPASSAVPELARVRVAYLPITPSLPLFVGLEEGSFSKRAVAVEALRFESSNAMMDALAAGRVDAAMSIASTTALIAEEKQQGLFKVFAVNENGVERNLDVLLVPSDSTLASVAELRGKKIATFPGALAATMLKRYLRGEGVEPGGVTIVELKQGLQVEALERHQVDALLAYEPTGVIAVRKGAARVLVKAPFTKVLNPWPGGFFVVSSNFLKTNPITAKEFIEAVYASIDSINANETRARGFLTKYFAMDAETAAGVPLTAIKRIDDVDARLVQEFADIFVEEGVLRQGVNVSAVFLKLRDAV